MGGHVVIPIVVTVVVSLLAAYLIGTGELDEAIARWLHDRDVHESVRAEERKKAALRGPRVLRP